MARGKHKPVTIGPIWRLGIEFQEFGIEHRCDVGHAHRHARMTAVCGLHSIHGQRPNCIGHLLLINGHVLSPQNTPDWEREADAHNICDTAESFGANPLRMQAPSVKGGARISCGESVAKFALLRLHSIFSLLQRLTKGM